MERVSRRSGLSPFLQYAFAAAILLSSPLVTHADIDDSSSEIQQQNVVRSKVKVAVYFETLCPDSTAFFANQLRPTYTLLQDIMDLEFVPFGKAVARPIRDGNRVKIEFECQHGPRECQGNRIMSCAQSFLPTYDQYRLFTCIMTARDPASAGQACSEQLSLNWATIASCSTSRLGAVLLYLNGRKTAAIRPQLYHVPTITINGRYDRSSLNESERSLLQQVCRTYGGSHPNCP